MGSRDWWNIVKDEQRETRNTTIPSLIWEAALRAKHFSNPDLNRPPPILPQAMNEKFSSITLPEGEVYPVLQSLKGLAMRPDNLSLCLLHRCAKQLSYPITRIFNACLSTRSWPRSWKIRGIVSFHKKETKNNVKKKLPSSLPALCTEQGYREHYCKANHTSR